MTVDTQFKKDKKTLLVLVSIGWLLCVGLIAGLAVPLTMKIYAQKDELEKGRLKVQALKADLGNSEKYQTLRESIGESKDLLERAVLKESTVVLFIEDLEKTARETGNLIEIAPYTPPKKKKSAAKEDDPTEGAPAAATPQAATPAAPAADAPAESKNTQYFQLTVKGDYIPLLSFLAKLENMGYVFKINSIDARSNLGKKTVTLGELEGKDKAGAEGNLETKIIISFSLQK